jgi:hypothetical protein
MESPRTSRTKSDLLGEELAEVDPILLLERQIGQTGRDRANQRQAFLFVNRFAGEFDGAGLVGAALDQALLLQRSQVTHDPVGRANAEILANLAHGGSVTAFLDLIANEFINLALTIGHLIHHGHGMFLYAMKLV